MQVKLGDRRYIRQPRARKGLESNDKQKKNPSVFCTKCTGQLVFDDR